MKNVESVPPIAGNGTDIAYNLVNSNNLPEQEQKK